MLCLSHPPHPLACGLLSYLHPSQIHTLSRSLSTGKCFQQLSFSLLCTSEELVFNHISPPMKADTHHVLLCCSRQHVTNRSPVEIQGVDYICMVQRRASQLTHSINRADEKWGLREGRRKSQSVYHAYKKVAVWLSLTLSLLLTRTLFPASWKASGCFSSKSLPWGQWDIPASTRTRGKEQKMT